MNPCPACSESRSNLESVCARCGWSPGDARTESIQPSETRSGSGTAGRRSSIWWAYFVAPAVAPCLFSICFFLIGIIWLASIPDDTGTPVGVIVVPLLGMTVGIILSYVLTGIVGMPIVWWLERREQLNGPSIHLLALLLLAMPLAALALIGLANRSGEMSVGATLAPALGFFLIASPFVLVSATTFWWIVSRGVRGVSFRFIMLALTVMAVALAATAPLWRSWF